MGASLLEPFTPSALLDGMTAGWLGCPLILLESASGKAINAEPLTLDAEGTPGEDSSGRRCQRAPRTGLAMGGFHDRFP